MRHSLSAKDRYLGHLSMAVVVAFLTQGCANQTTVDEKIYRVTSVSGTNYYRVRILSSAMNGKAYFKAGLYPAYAVDMFRGQETELPTELIDAETEMRRLIVSAQTNALKKFLDSDESSRKTAADNLVNAQEIVIAKGGRPIGTNGTNLTTTPIQFNPIKALIDYTANKKFVIALSSDPDEILNQISAFVEEAKTTEAIQEAVGSQLAGAVAPEVERAKLRNNMVKSLIEALETEAKRADVDTATKLAELITKLNARLEGLK